MTDNKTQSRVIPVGEFYQELQLLTKNVDADGVVRFEERIIHAVRFVPMIKGSGGGG